MSQVLLLDSNVWSHLILGDRQKQHAVRGQLAALRAKYPGATRATSGINVAEALVAARRLPDASAAARFEALFHAEFERPDLVVVPVTQRVLDNAARLRADSLKLAKRSGNLPAGPDGGKLKLPDAIVAASCLAFDPPAILVTENAGDFQYLDQGILQTVANLVVEKIG